MRLARPTQRDAMRPDVRATGSLGVTIDSILSRRTPRRSVGGGRRASSAAGPARRCVRASRDPGRAATPAPRRRIVDRQQVHAEGPQFVEHGIVADGDRPPVGDGLDDRVPEALPRRREEDEVGGGVGVGRGLPPVRRPPAPRVRDEPREHVVVAVFRGPGDPEPDRRVRFAAAPARPRTRSRPGCSSAGSRAVGCRSTSSSGAKPNAARVIVAVAAPRLEVERVAQGDRREPAVLELDARAVVDGHVQRVLPVRRDAGRRRQSGALPRKIVVMEHDPTVVVGEDGCGHGRRVGLIGSEQRFSTTTRSAPAMRGRERVGLGRDGRRPDRWRGRTARCRRGAARRRARRRHVGR